MAENTVFKWREISCAVCCASHHSSVRAYFFKIMQEVSFHTLCVVKSHIAADFSAPNVCSGRSFMIHEWKSESIVGKCATCAKQ